MKRLLFIFPLLLMPLFLVAQEDDYIPPIYQQGTDFWVGFMHNGQYPYNEPLPAHFEAHLMLQITSDDTCYVTAQGMPTPSRPDGWRLGTVVVPNKIATIEIPWEQFLVNECNTIQAKSLHVTSTDTVSIHMLNYMTVLNDSAIGAADATTLIPTPMLRDDYMIQTAEFWRDSEGLQEQVQEPSEIMIIATEDNTEVQITLTDSIYPHIAPHDITIYLNRGDLYMFYGQIPPHPYPCNDLSGTRIRSNCKPIAVFQANKLARYPHSEYHGLDFICEQAVPTEFWGKEHIVVGNTFTFANPNDPRTNLSSVRITALEDNTTVTRNGFPIGTINSGQTLTDTINRLFGAYLYQSNNQVCVGHYTWGGIPITMPNGEGGLTNPIGDNSMVMVPPVNQMVSNRLKFGVVGNGYPSRAYTTLIITTRTEDVPNTWLFRSMQYLSYQDILFEYWDSMRIDHRFQEIDGTPYSWTAIPILGNDSDELVQYHVTERAFYIQNHNGGKFDARICKNEFASCYYRAAHTHPSNVFLYVNDTLADSLPSDSLWCIYDTVNFHMLAQRDSSRIYWHYGDGRDTTVHAVDSGVYVRHRFSQPGTHTVTCWAVYPDEGCFTPKPDTLTVTLHVVGNIDTLVDTLVCEGPFSFYDHTFTESSLEDIHVPWFSQCDTIFHLNLNVVNRWAHIWDTIHESQLPWNFNGHIYNDVTTFDTIILNDDLPCDSIIIYSLRIRHDQMQPPLDSTALWVPNVFTPSEPTNNIFFVRGYEISEVEVLIFDRMGRKLYEWEGLDGGWDGTHNGSPCSQAGYVYLIRYKTIHSDGYKYAKGVVTLIR